MTDFGGSNRLSVGGLVSGFAGLVTDGGCLVRSFGKSCLPLLSGFIFSGHGVVVIGLLPPVPPVVPLVPLVRTPRGPSLVVLMPGVVVEWEEMCMEEMAMDLLLAPALENWSWALTARREYIIQYCTHLMGRLTDCLYYKFSYTYIHNSDPHGIN